MTVSLTGSRSHQLFSVPRSRKFLNDIQIHQKSARLTIAKAQETRSKYYNKGHKKAPELELGSLVLDNPHSLEWKESRGKGAKLIQRWLGPFKVLEKINPKFYRLRLSDKYPSFPVFNIEHLKEYASKHLHSPPMYAQTGTSPGLGSMTIAILHRHFPVQDKKRIDPPT